MSARPAQPEKASGLPDKDPRAIRDALVVPEDIRGFDAGLDQVVAEVRATLDVTRLHEFIHTWWLIACDNVKDPQSRVEMYERGARIRRMAARGERLPRGDKPWRRLLVECGIEVDS